MSDDGGSAPLGPAGYGITGSGGGGGTGGQYVFADLAELDGTIAEFETLRDDIRGDGAKLLRAQQLIEPPGEDIMSRIEAKTTVHSLEKAIEHNTVMAAYADAEIAKMRAAQAAYANADVEGAARLRMVDEG
jgi:hypothetical protein